MKIFTSGSVCDCGWLVWIISAALTWSGDVTEGQESRQDIVGFETACAAAADGALVKGYLDLVEYQPGKLPLILAAPHGGRNASAEFPVRTSGTLVSDSNTDRLARAVADAMSEFAGARPHLVVCQLHRKYMDANRPLDAACAADSGAVKTWHEYQQALQVAKRRVTAELSRGLFIELHGHAHAKRRLEIGYLLRERDFDLPAAEFERLAEKTSVREILERRQVSLEGLIRGDSSLGGLLEKEGVSVVPGPTNRDLGKDLYFNGGWNTMTHGSRDAGTISSIQIECHRDGFRDSEASMKRSSAQLAAAIIKFLELHYAVPKQLGK